jgi:DNA polymerase-1
MATKRLFIIDTMAVAFRSFYAFGQRPLTTSDGLPVSAVYGTAMFLNKLISEHRPDYLVAACDTKEPTFRHKMYPEYKANRSEMPEDLAAQLPLFFKLFEAMNIPMIRRPGIEADDIAGTLAHKLANKDLHVYIVSGDKDFMQLVNDHVFVYQPKKGDESVIIDREGVRLKFGVLPEQVIDCLTIIGDTSDNVPGVHGIGEKGAEKLLNDYGSLDAVYENLDKISNKRQRTALENARDKIELTRTLVTIKTDCDVPLDVNEMLCCHATSIANKTLADLYSQLEFKNLAAKTADIVNKREKEAARTSFDQLSASQEAGTGPKYVLANTPALLSDVLAHIANADTFCFDTETTGLNVITDKPIGVSLSVGTEGSWYVPLINKHLAGVTAQDVHECISVILKSPEKLKVGHNIKFDLQMLANIGIEVSGPFADTMVADYLIDANARLHNLDACCLKYLNYQKIPTASLIGTNGEISMLSVDLDDLTTYACEDADLTLRLYRHMEPLLKAAGLLEVFKDVEMPLVPVLASMEQRGIFVDKNHLHELDIKLSEMILKLEDLIYDLAGEEFNINSPKQLGNIVFERLKIHEQLGVKSIKKTKTGYSTDESVLSKLSEHALPRTILEYRTVFKLKNTYVSSLPTLINCQSGRVHTSFHQTVTATGRLSSSEPNLQNIPIRTELGQSIRKAFKPSHEDSVIISADYSQIELRILAHLADEKALLKAFQDKEDIHQLTASKIFSVLPKEVTSDMRSRAKAINFGIIYGMGPRRLAADTGVSQAEATEFIDKYFAGYPGISAYINDSIKLAREHGYCETITGRRRPLPELSYSGGRAAASAENIAVNTPIQGSAADLIKLAMIKIENRFKQNGLRSKMILQVHDELIFEVPKEEIDEAVDIIKDSMEHAMTLKVPLEVQIGIGSNWLEAH